MTRNQLRPNLLSACIAVSLYGLANPASAIPTFTVNGTYNLGTSAGPGATQVNGTPSVSTTGTDVLDSPSDPLGNSLFFHTYGLAGPPNYFGARVSGTGTFFGTTSSSITEVFTNTSSVTQNYVFQFQVESGEASIAPLAGNGSANLLLQVKRNGSVISFSDTTVTASGGSSTCTESSSGALASYTECGTATDSSVSGNGGLFVVDLGNLAPNESFTLDYDIVATVSNEFTGVCSGGDGYGGELQTFVGTIDGYGGGCYFDSAIARSGDPFRGPDTNALPSDQTVSFNVTASPVGSVPEPGTLALLGAGILGWGRRVRRR